MRARPSPSESLAQLPQLHDPAERRAAWRQAVAALGKTAGVAGPPPLDGIDPGVLERAVELALGSGLADDLDWIAPGSAAVALYEITSALPVGRSRRELGRRVFARLYEGTAATFAAVATRMALGWGKPLEAPTLRARVALVFELPAGSSVNADALALTLITRHELRAHWIDAAATGALPARRLSAKLFEYAAREAVQRSLLGDPFAANQLLSEPVQPRFRMLLSDREPLVWQHAAVARGLLASVVPELREQIDLGLDPALTPFEWRRAAVSLVACIAADPEAGLADCRGLIDGPIVKRDPGILASMVLGLPRVLEAEPDAAEELLDRLSVARRPDVAEAAAALLGDVLSPNFGSSSLPALKEVLEKRASSENSVLRGIAAQALSVLTRRAQANENVQEAVRQALVAYEAQGAKSAHELSVVAAETAHRRLDALARANPDTEAEALGALSDLDAAALEHSCLSNLLLLARRPGETDASVPLVERLHNRLGGWLIERESVVRIESKNDALSSQRRLRALLHLVDHETTRSEADEAGVRNRVRRSVRSLLLRLVSGPDPLVQRILCATLARSFDASVREGVLEPSGVLLAIARNIHDHASIETLAEASTNPDLSGAIRAYADFVRPWTADDADVESVTRFDGDLEGLRLARRVLTLSRTLSSGGSYRSEALRRVVFRLGRALEAVAQARGLAELVDRSGTGSDVLGELAFFVDALTRLLAHAQDQVMDDDSDNLSIEADVTPLSTLAERAVGSSTPPNPEELKASVSELVANLPPAFATLVERVLTRLATLPVEAASDVYAIPLEKRRANLPDWLMPRRTVGAFYVVRPLGSGGVSSVFIARRVEERHDPKAESFALKVPEYDPTTARSLSEQEFMQLFREEAGALLSLPQHPNLARFVTFDLGARPKPVLVMELIKGFGLDRLVRSRALNTALAFSLLDGVLAGLEAMHAVGVAHLDVKPSNVILRNGEMPVLVDFGLSGRKLRPGCGTLEYCAPEVLGVGSPEAVAQACPADLYAFGCLSFELFTAELLFSADDEIGLASLHVTHDGWPDKLAQLAADPRLSDLCIVLAACLRNDPRKRPTARDARAALADLCTRLEGVAWPLRPRTARTGLTA